MRQPGQLRVALVYPGDLAARRAATPANNRFAALFTALAERGAQALPAVYHDEFRDQVRAQLLGVDCALVWVNPLQDGRDRSELDALLREVAAAGVAVSTHPDVILAMGTKEVLHRTRDLGWGGDTRLYRDPGQLRRELPEQLAAGAVRVLKQLRGNGGSGVWKVEAASPGDPARVRVRHAQRGAVEQEIPFEEFLALCAPYFAASGGMVDQAWQPRLVEGTVRCYLVHDRVAGFGHQAVNALHPAPAGAPATAAPPPGPRLYHPPDRPQFQPLRRRLEEQWVPALQETLGLDRASLPVLWDADFLLGPRDAAGADTHVLCEINVCSVAPYPDSAVAPVADAALALAAAARRRGRER